MSEFSVNVHRRDPYKNFRFAVIVDGQPVAGLSKMSALKKMTETVEWREAGDPGLTRKMPGRVKYEPVTMEAGITYDTTFEDWANTVNNIQGDAANSLANYRKDINVEMHNMQGVTVLRWTLYRCWVSEYQATPDLDANANAVAISHLKLEYEGFQRDTSLTEQAET
jgi:phage tail-like protein